MSELSAEYQDQLAATNERTKLGKKKYNKKINLMKYHGRRTSIRISEQTRKMLIALARFGESYNDIIIRLCDYDKRINKDNA